MLLPEATTAAARRSPRGWSSARAAVAVPVTRPAARPLTTRAAMSSQISVAARNSAVLTAAQATARTSTFLRPMWSLRSPSAISANSVPSDVGGEDHGHPERAEAHLLLVQHVQRDGQGPAQHDDQQDAGRGPGIHGAGPGPGSRQ